MSNPSNALIAVSSSRLSAAALSGPAESSSAPRSQVLPSVITYSYASRLVYVASAETYDDAIDLAKESFPDLKDVESERISFEVKVNAMKTQESKAGIGRTAWPAVMASLVRFQIVEICVAPVVPETAAALSSCQASVVEPPPYAPEKSGWSGSQAGITPPGSQSRARPSLATRILNLF